MSEIDEDSIAGESWMDASIRLHLRRQGGERENNDGDAEEEESIVPLSLPHENKPDSFGSYSQLQNATVLVAELVAENEVNDTYEDKRPQASTLPDTNTQRESIIQDPIPTQNKKKQNSSSPKTQGTNVRLKRRCGLAKKKDRFKTNASVSKFIVTRTSLPYTIEHNEMTMQWTALVNTNQYALDEDDTELIEESVVTMTFKSLEEAREACHAYAPPRMHSFEDSPKCHICKKSFNRFLRRPFNCKNCGLCVCSSCTRNWPGCMLPITYHTGKRKRFFKVCMACDWLNITFRQALLSGNYDQAIALKTTGNVNTRCPFANVRGETYYPVHCAVLGGNLAMFKWLVNILCCPINSRRRIPLLNSGSVIGVDPIITSRGKSVFDLAMESSELGILHFLIVEKGVNVMQYKNLMIALRTLKATIHHLPEHLRV